jgi:hypothetical protein
MDYFSKPFLSAAAILLFAAGPVAAQTSVTAAERAARERMARDAAESEEREMMLEMMERYHRSGEKTHEPRLALAQIREDFVRLQVVNNDLAKAAEGGGQLDLKFVAKSASEIKKRAERLKENLALPGPEDGEKAPPAGLTPADLEQLRTTLSRLDGIVLRFANNLHAKGVRRSDAQMSGRLRRDLEAIVSLSERVKKSSEKLGGATR